MALDDLIAWAQIALAASAGCPEDEALRRTLRGARLDLLTALASAGFLDAGPVESERRRSAVSALAEDGALAPALIADDLAWAGSAAEGAPRGPRPAEAALVWHGLAVALREAGYKPGAIRALESSLEADPSCLGGWLMLGDLARETRNVRLMTAAAEAAAKIAPSDPRVASLVRAASPAGADLDEAQALFRDGNRSGALARAKAALEKDPTSSAAWIVNGQLAASSPGGAQAAADAFLRALELQPGHAEIQVMLADSLCSLGRLDEAAERLSRVLQERPSDLAALLALARVREGQKDPGGAQALLSKAVQDHPDAPEAARRLGDVLKRRGLLKEALDWHWRSAGMAAPGPAGGRRRAIFLVQHVPMWLNMESVYAAFFADPAWDVTVVAMPHFHPYCVTDEERNAIFGHLQEEGVSFVRWDRFELRAGCADVMFVLTPWEVVRAPGWRTEELLRLGLRLVYIPYCFEAAHDDLDHASQFDEPLHQLAWAVCARSAQHKALFARHCSVGDAHVSVTGHPKADALRRLEAARDPELEAFVGGRKAVCWNPHFDVVEAGAGFGTGYSTFMRWWRFMIDEFARRTDMVLLIRPHPLLFSLLARRGVWTQAEIEAFLERCAASSNIHLDRRPSYLPAFAASHAMMSDISTFVLEYPMTGKPLLYLRNPRNPFTEEGVVAGELCEAAETEAHITRFLDTVADGSDPRAAERRTACAKIVYHPPWGAGAAIKRLVDSRLEAEAGTIGPLRQAV